MLILYNSQHVGILIAFSQYGANVYRPGSGNLPNRLVSILNMSPLPDFVEIITWNDAPESHYIGDIWPEFTYDTQSLVYQGAAKWSHTGWQSMITAFIAAYKSGSKNTSPPSDTVVGSIWYKTILQDAHCPFDNGQLGGYNEKPYGFSTGDDNVYWGIVLPADAVDDGWVVQTLLNGHVVTTTELEGSDGLNWGKAPIGAGNVQVQVIDCGGNIVATASGGRCISRSCPDGIYNMNLQVVPFEDTEDSLACFNY